MISMDDVLEKIEYENIEGEKTDHKATIYALSTCAFCRKAINFVRDNNVAFRYVYLDKIPLETKKEVKAELKSRYKNLPVFPVLVVDDDKALSGFTESQWKEALDIS
mgnify:CR=1 FL=1